MLRSWGASARCPPPAPRRPPPTPNTSATSCRRWACRCRRRWRRGRCGAGCCIAVHACVAQRPDSPAAGPPCPSGWWSGSLACTEAATCLLRCAWQCQPRTCWRCQRPAQPREPRCRAAGGGAAAGGVRDRGYGAAARAHGGAHRARPRPRRAAGLSARPAVGSCTPTRPRHRPKLLTTAGTHWRADECGQFRQTDLGGSTARSGAGGGTLFVGTCLRMLPFYRPMRALHPAGLGLHCPALHIQQTLVRKVCAKGDL